MAKLEAHTQGSAAPSEAGHSRGTSFGHLPVYQEPPAIHPDSITLFAQGSFLEEDEHLELGEESNPLSSSHPEGSASAEEDAEKSSPSNVVSWVLSVAKIVGLVTPVEASSSSEGVWASISQSCPSVTIPAAEDYCQMLRRA